MTTNPFKELEPDDACPPRLKKQIMSDIDLIKNALTIVELYVGDLFGVVSALATLPSDSADSLKPNP
ncbi:hypothetical protein [Spirosoma fluminis]